MHAKRTCHDCANATKQLKCTDNDNRQIYRDPNNSKIYVRCTCNGNGGVKASAGCFCLHTRPCHKQTLHVSFHCTSTLYGMGYRVAANNLPLDAEKFMRPPVRIRLKRVRQSLKRLPPPKLGTDVCSFASCSPEQQRSHLFIVIMMI